MLSMNFEKNFNVLLPLSSLSSLISVELFNVLLLLSPGKL